MSIFDVNLCHSSVNRHVFDTTILRSILGLILGLTTVSYMNIDISYVNFDIFMSKMMSFWSFLVKIGRDLTPTFKTYFGLVLGLPRQNRQTSTVFTFWF